MIVFDIETGPLPLSEIPEFDPGEPPKNINRPETIAEWRAKKEAERMENLALNPETGKVLVIGCFEINPGEKLKKRLFEGEESNLLAEWWEFWRNHISFQCFVGFCSTHFDLPFLVMRSLKLNVPVHSTATNPYHLRASHIDLYMRLHPKHQMSLDKLAAWMGIPGKLGDGKHFAESYENKATRKNALDYLKRDLEITLEAARRLGVS